MPTHPLSHLLQLVSSNTQSLLNLSLSPIKSQSLVSMERLKHCVRLPDKFKLLLDKMDANIWA